MKHGIYIRGALPNESSSAIMEIDTILLQPRPYERSSGRLLLLPLLPPTQPATSLLPAEIWYHIFSLALLDDEKNRLGGALLAVCKFFKVSLQGGPEA